MNATQIGKIARELGLLHCEGRLAHNYGRRSATNPSLPINNKTTRREIEEYARRKITQDTQCGTPI